MSKSPNVVLISIDALRADHLSCQGYSRETTPVLDDLANENAWFKRALSTSSHTREAVPSLLTGRYPDEFSDQGYRLIEDSIARRLREASYATAGFHSNPYASRAYGFETGFDTFEDNLYLGNNRLLALGQRLLDKIRNRHYTRAEKINEQSLEWLDNLGDNDPFFLWNHYMDPHGPYQPLAKYRELFTDDLVSDRTAKKLYRRSINYPGSITESERELQKALYDAEIRYLDDQIGAFLNALTEREYLENTIVVITADHGDAFGEHGYYGHPRELDDELLHVPLVVLGKDVPEVVVDTPVSTLDIVPTLLTAGGYEPDGLPGQPLQEAWGPATDEEDQVVFSQAKRENEPRRLYRITGRDGNCVCEVPIESDSVPDLNCEDGNLEDALKEHIRTRIRRERIEHETDDDEVGAELDDRLQALGYK